MDTDGGAAGRFSVVKTATNSACMTKNAAPDLEDVPNWLNLVAAARHRIAEDMP